MNCYCEEITRDDMRVTRKCFKELWLFEDLTEDENEEYRAIGSRQLFHPGQAIFFKEILPMICSLSRQGG